VRTHKHATMATEATETKPEIQVSTQWGVVLCPRLAFEGFPGQDSLPHASGDPHAHGKKKKNQRQRLEEPQPRFEAHSDYDPDMLFSVEHVFSEGECAELIRLAEGHGFGYTDYRKSYRGNLRLITTDWSLSEVVWQRIRDMVPQEIHDAQGVWRPYGLNECWRLAKYFPKDRFAGHYDACFARSKSDRSMFTVNIYMNGDCTGGRTRFYEKRKASTPNASFTPTPGLALVFRQPDTAMLWHDGEALESGLKYLFRTDVMYRLDEVEPEVKQDTKRECASVEPISPEGSSSSSGGNSTSATSHAAPWEKKGTPAAVDGLGVQPPGKAKQVAREGCRVC